MRLAFLFCSVMLLSTFGCVRAAEKTIEVKGDERTYILHIPKDLPKDKNVPLVFVFHGGGGEGKGMERLTRFTSVADREKFIVVFPDGIGKHWYDGRDVAPPKGRKEAPDDVAFVAAMIDSIDKQRPIDKKRIYATGMSNGGIFSHYLGAKLSEKIAAIAPVVGGISEPFRKDFKPEKPVSVFVIQGVDDPIVPFKGGKLSFFGRGSIISTDDSLALWVEKNGCDKEAKTGELADSDAKDGCRVKTSRWSKGKDGTEVVFYKIEGGGHTWPTKGLGGQYLPEKLIGRVCRDFDASETIWDFFKAHPKP